MSASVMAQIGDFPHRGCGRKVCFCNGDCLRPTPIGGAEVAPWNFDPIPWKQQYPFVPPNYRHFWEDPAMDVYDERYGVSALRPEDV